MQAGTEHRRMTEWSFRERGREYRVSEHAGTVEHVQTIARTTMHGSSQSAALYTPASVRLDARTVVTQRVFMDDGQGSKWSFDCEDNIPIRPGARLLLRYLSAESIPADVAYIADQESNWQVVRPGPIGRLVRPRWRSLVAVCVGVLVALFAVAEISNASVSQYYGPGISRAGGPCLAPDARGSVVVQTPRADACLQAMSALPFTPVVIAGLWLIWHLRRRSLRTRLNERLIRGQGV